MTFSRIIGIPADPAGRSNFIRLELVGAKRRNGKIDLVPDERLFFLMESPPILNFMGVMKKPITSRISHRWLSKDLIPLFKGKLAGYKASLDILVSHIR
jgi:hypothetical protein